MNWIVIIDGYAKKYLKRIPKKDSNRIKEMLRELVFNPFAGDLEKMSGDKDVWRRRVGAYRILYEIHENKKFIFVFEIKRRASNTY